MFNLFSTFVNSSKTNPRQLCELRYKEGSCRPCTEEIGARVDLALKTSIGAHVAPIVEKPITNLDANFESQGTSTNQEKGSR